MDTRRENAKSSNDCYCIYLTIPISFSLIRGTNLNGWIIPVVVKDWLQTTEDEKYEYRIELVNQFQRNNRTKLYIKDLSTGKEMTIRLKVSTEIFGGASGQNGRTREPSSWELLSTLVPTEKDNIYTLTTKESYDSGGVVFELDVAKGTAIELSRKILYKTRTEVVDDENGDRLYSYSLQLTDTYQRKNRTDISVLLNINVKPPQGGNSISYAIPLPVDRDLLENKSLRQRRKVTPSTSAPPLWVTLEATDTPGQFVVQTTEDLSTDVTLTFLVDVELGVIG
jgi:hypothetical protein